MEFLFWDERNVTDKRLATGEAQGDTIQLRSFLYHGAPHVFSNPSSEFDDEFVDNFFMPSNIWLHYKNEVEKKY